MSVFNFDTMIHVYYAESFRILQALILRIADFPIDDANAEDYSTKLRLLKTKFKQVHT